MHEDHLYGVPLFNLESLSSSILIGSQIMPHPEPAESSVDTIYIIVFFYYMQKYTMSVVDRHTRDVPFGPRRTSRWLADIAHAPFALARELGIYAVPQGQPLLLTIDCIVR